MNKLQNPNLLPQQQQRFITLRFQAEEGKYLFKLSIRSLHEDECRFDTELKIQSADITLPEQAAHLIKAIIPINNLLEITVIGDDTPLAQFIEMELQIAKPPTPDKFFAGWHSSTFSISKSVLDLWEQCGSPTKWYITSTEAAAFLEKSRQEQLKRMQELAKQRGLTS